MARKTTKGAQAHPKGGLMTIDHAERDRLKLARETEGWDQKGLARRAGVTAATISNLEGGRSKQIRKTVYAKVLRALRSPDAAPSETHDRVVAIILDATAALDLRDTEMVAELAQRLAEARKTTKE